MCRRKVNRPEFVSAKRDVITRSSKETGTRRVSGGLQTEDGLDRSVVAGELVVGQGLGKSTARLDKSEIGLDKPSTRLDISETGLDKSPMKLGKSTTGLEKSETGLDKSEARLDKSSETRVDERSNGEESELSM